jgi:KaiC/GvpD/RAD55 family RecA-like ATPase
MRGIIHSNRLSAGTPNYDEILLRGLPGNQAILIEDNLATERIALATQFILKGKGSDEYCRGLTLSESNSLT